jgi:hypothetical protein
MAHEKEQIENWAKGKHFNRKRAKRDMHKLRRQSERRDIEDAMTKNRYRGWSY